MKIKSENLFEKKSTKLINLHIDQEKKIHRLSMSGMKRIFLLQILTS